MKRFAPDLAAFSVLTTNYEWACKLSRKVRDALGIPVVWGGIHVTSLPEEVLKNEFVDYAIVGGRGICPSGIGPGHRKR